VMELIFGISLALAILSRDRYIDVSIQCNYIPMCILDTCI